MNRFIRAETAFLLAACLWAAPPVWGEVWSQCPPDTDGVNTDGIGGADDDHVCMHITAGDGFVNMADGRLMYMFGFGEVPAGTPDDMVMMDMMLGAEASAPTITVREGQKLFLNLTNVGMVIRPDLFDPHTVHYHGFPQAAPIFDGMPDGSISINMGFTLTYFYNIVLPGTYMYHCHVEATEHMQMGMLGNLYVLPKQDGTAFVHGGRSFTKFAYNDGDGSTGYDVAYPIQITAFDPDFHQASHDVQPLPFALMEDKYPLLNGRGYPDTINPLPLLNSADEEGFMPRYSQRVSSLITATKGQRILLRVSSLATVDFYTLTVLGIPMRVVGEDARLLRGPGGADLSYETTSLTLGGGQSADVILDTQNVAAGTYFLYCTNLNNLSNDAEDFGGMMTEIVISP
ncbi:MAG: multicopper oxidase domain-containing protein [Phycisphaerae bacterium]|nr:multicopper oxidase domain-containing protein [Phycisphaerae bacterium]